MSKFVAGTAVERLEYDFSDYGGGSGTIPEPSRGAVKAYFKGLKGLMRETAELRGFAERNPDEDMSDAEVTELMSKVDEAEERSEEFHQEQLGLLAQLCGAELVDGVWKGGTPSLPDLECLPFRVFQAFNQWLLSEIQPKKAPPGTNR